MRKIAALAAAIMVLGGKAAAQEPPQTAAPIDPPAGEGALAPNLTKVGDGALLTWLEPTGPSDDSADVVYRLRFAGFDGDAWGPPATIVEGSDFFANWADVPSITRAGDGALVAHWLQRSGADTYAYDVLLARSTDGGKTWKHLGPAHDDGTKTEHGFVSLVSEAGGVRAFWLDGREMAGHGAGNMTLRTTLVGETVGAGIVLDDRVCECCCTSAVLTARGPLIAYRDRGPDEVRDIFVARWADGAWTPPQRVHDDGWVIAACPVNGPAVDARGGLVVVAWYTAAANRPAVRVAFSADAGATFDPPITVDDTWPVGRVDVVLDPSGHAIVSWLAKGPHRGAIMLRRISADGRTGPPMRAARASVARSGGFPRMVAVERSLLLTWTEDGDTTRLRALQLPQAAVGAVEAP
ncbi:MAG: sialidase family protein [Planctomycetota bacterium]|jgi:hypothetical protein